MQTLVPKSPVEAASPIIIAELVSERRPVRSFRQGQRRLSAILLMPIIGVVALSAMIVTAMVMQPTLIVNGNLGRQKIERRAVDRAEREREIEHCRDLGPEAVAILNQYELNKYAWYLDGRELSVQETIDHAKLPWYNRFAKCTLSRHELLTKSD